MAVGLADLLIVVGMLGVVIAVAYVALIARTSRGGQAATPPRDPAVDALRTRFAVGHIDEAEFERLRSVLQRH